ncbi:MAG TPA: hypothetical protein VMC79_00300 [Rectinemataceae bacterium]|nr:hypothetical protein [Rectinemataceae bacterium]
MTLAVLVAGLLFKCARAAVTRPVDMAASALGVNLFMLVLNFNMIGAFLKNFRSKDVDSTAAAA